MYDKLKRVDLGRIPEQYRLESCQARKKLDTAFLQAIGVRPSVKSLDEFYEQIDSAISQWLGVGVKEDSP
jgi:hypothetical protein